MNKYAVQNLATIEILEVVEGNSWESGKVDISPAGRAPRFVEKGRTYYLTLRNVRGETVLENQKYQVGSGLIYDKKGKENPFDAVAALCAFISDAENGNQTFNDFCLELGLNTDSRKALDSYLETQEIAHAFNRGFTAHERQQLTDLYNNY